MNITSLEIAQATMDMFFCLFCLIIFVSIKANYFLQRHNAK